VNAGVLEKASESGVTRVVFGSVSLIPFPPPMNFSRTLLFPLLVGLPLFAEVTTVHVPMRDGVQLAADIYREAGAASGPVVLTRTPYDRRKQKATGERWAKAGYTFVAQDCRGKFGSEGEFAPYNNEGQDGYDTLEWIMQQSWCGGRVGMVGASYVGAVQWQAAVEHPLGLVAIAPQATWSSFYRNLYLGGCVRLSLIAGWLSGNSPRPKDVVVNDFSKAWLQLPLNEVDRAMGWEMPWLDAFLTHPRPDGFWTRLDLSAHLPELKLPALHVVGYYDYFSRESVDNFVRMQKQARDPETRSEQRLILGPWDHGTIGKSTVGEVDFGAGAVLDTQALQIEWFNRHLKKESTAPFVPVRYFSMGDNEWHEAQTWPPEGFTETAFYLQSGGRANTDGGNGRLSREAPAGSQPADRFKADPADPVPSSPVTEQRPLKGAVWGPVDQAPTEKRGDVLVYTSEPLATPLEFAGTAEAVLHVSTDTPDADWAVKLVDVHPEGFAQNIARGILRGRYRNSLLKPELMEAGVVYEIRVDLGPVAARLEAGHRLRVDISGADFPLYDRNPNTAAGIFGSETVVATEAVHHAPEALSRIVLPVR
jgi:putative CocE/NonD family hydrolase